MNQPKEKDEEKQDVPIPPDEELPSPVREPEKKTPVEEPESEEPKKIAKT